MKLIVAVDENWGIGKDNSLLFSIPEDMAFFRTATKGKIVVMGRLTLQSLPGCAPLKNRENIVLTQNATFACDGAQICTTVQQLCDILSRYNSDDIFIIGGDSIYNQFFDCCEEAYITKVFADGSADKFFPNLDNLPNWQQIEQSDTKSIENLEYCFCTYKNSAVKPVASLCG